MCLHFSSSDHEKQKPTRAAPGPKFIFVWMCHCFTMFQNCPRDGHVAAFITLKYRIYCKVLIRGVSQLFELCTWNEETNKSLCLSTSDITAQRLEKKHDGSQSSQTMHRTHVLLDCAAGIITIHTYKYRTLCLGIMVVIIPLHVFFQCPNKLPNHNIHRDIKF